MPFSKEVGRRLRELRESSGLNQTDLAERVGVSTRTISRIERGESVLDVQVAVRICSELKVSPNWLLGYPGEQASREAVQAYRKEEDVEQRAQRLSAMLNELFEPILKGEADTFLDMILRHDSAACPVFPLDDQHDVPFEDDYPPQVTKNKIPRPRGLRGMIFAVELLDNSMEPEFARGDTLFFDVHDPANGEFGLFRLDDDSTVFRKLLQYPDDDQVRLVALNYEYPELRMSKAKVKKAFRLVAKFTRYHSGE